MMQKIANGWFVEGLEDEKNRDLSKKTCLAYRKDCCNLGQERG